MAYYAIIKGEIVDGIAISDSPLETDGMWIDVTEMVPMPQTFWKYKDGNFFAPDPATLLPINIPEPKTDEEKLTEAAAALVAKLIADGVLKQA
jgi:hypothetical protein